MLIDVEPPVMVVTDRSNAEVTLARLKIDTAISGKAQFNIRSTGGSCTVGDPVGGTPELSVAEESPESANTTSASTKASTAASTTSAEMMLMTQKCFLLDKPRLPSAR